jgi:catechol 2,3-dioxygenase-like lactoylglutathione lyase family enzyme
VLGSSHLIGFVATTDFDRARRFYLDVLGLRLVDESPFALVFDAHGTMLRVTAVDAVATPGYTVLGWRVDDVVASVRQLTEAGVNFCRYNGLTQDEHAIWTTPGGDQIAWFLDPDGNTLSLTQFH